MTYGRRGDKSAGRRTAEKQYTLALESAALDSSHTEYSVDM